VYDIFEEEQMARSNMSKTVLIQDIVDALDMQFDEYSSYVDLDTGKVETVAHDVLSEAEEGSDDEDPDFVPDPEDHEWQIAKRIVETDRFVELPSKFEVHEWSIMEEFAHEVESATIRNELLRAIHGAGAFGISRTRSADIGLRRIGTLFAAKL